MPLLSPEFRERARKFRSNRRSFHSLLILAALFVIVLPAELICNDQPLILVVDGHWFFPAFHQYTYRNFGGDQDMPVVDYRSPLFTDFLAGQKVQIDLDAVYHRVGSAQASVLTTTPGRSHHVWQVSAPVPHSYKSSVEHGKLGREVLVSPLDRVEDGHPVSGGLIEKHYLGTDAYGKDVLARLIYGLRLSLLFGVALAVTSTLIGCVLGAIQGYFGGLVDLAGQRVTEIWGAIPQLMLMMLLSDFLGRKGTLSQDQHILMLFLILNLTFWMGMAAHMRAMFLRGRNLDYVKAARALGASNRRIMVTHILPNSLTPIVTFLPFAVSGGVMALVGLDFLGFGLKYPTPSLGEMLAQGQEHLEAWWIIVPTFLALSVLLILLTFVGEGVRNAFDPRYK